MSKVRYVVWSADMAYVALLGKHGESVELNIGLVVLHFAGGLALSSSSMVVVW